MFILGRFRRRVAVAAMSVTIVATQKARPLSGRERRPEQTMLPGT